MKRLMTSVLVSLIAAVPLLSIYDVVVVGAGLSGLTTAKRLRDVGADVAVYEARKRVGGRVLTALLNGQPIELGGQNICDGGDALCLRKLIADAGLEVSEVQLKRGSSYFNGTERLDRRQLVGDKGLNRETLYSDLEAIARDAKNMREVFDKLLGAPDDCYRLLETRLCAYEGGSLDDLSPRYIKTLYHIIGGGIAAAHADPTRISFAQVAGGNGCLAEKIATELGERVHLDRRLVGMKRISPDCYALRFRYALALGVRGMMEETVLARSVVLAMPCSVYEGISFDSSIIPADRLEAIKAVRYGKNAKTIIPLTQLPAHDGHIISDRIVTWFDASKMALTVYYATIGGFFTPVTTSGLLAPDMPALQAECGDALPLAAPVYAADASFQSYTGPVCYSWLNDPFVKGSYSFITAGQEEEFTATEVVDGERVKKLFAPLNDGTLYFAGEHASIIEETATMEAACEAGERAARMLLAKRRAQQ